MNLAARGLGLYILDDDGEPQPVAETLTWAAWMETARDRVVLQDRIGRVASVFVSTVFLGIDYRHGRDGPPILWETMIFRGPFDGFRDRYTSRWDALRGHARAVALAEAFGAVPRKTKKALRKFGASYGRSYPRGPIRAGEWPRVHRVLTRAGW